MELDVKPDAVSRFIDMFRREFISRSRAEEGCEQYELWRDPKAPEKMTIIEVWSSTEALDAHLAQDWFAEWAPKLEAAQATPPVIRTMKSIED